MAASITLASLSVSYGAPLLIVVELGRGFRPDSAHEREGFEPSVPLGKGKREKAESSMVYLLRQATRTGWNAGSHRPRARGTLSRSETSPILLRGGCVAATALEGLERSNLPPLVIRAFGAH